MKSLPMRLSALTLSVCLVVGGCDLNLLNLFFPATETGATSWILRWNRIAIDASGLDHTAVGPDEERVFGHQLGPTRSSRAMAIVHVAMYDAVASIDGRYASYAGLAPAQARTSMKAAVAQAAHDTLVALYPTHADTFAEHLSVDLGKIDDRLARDNGVALGRAAAAAILDMRSGDGSDVDEQYEFDDRPGQWRADPLNPGQQPLGEEWYNVGPFVMRSAAQFRAPEPPTINSAEYAAAYDEAFRLGGDGITTPTERTEAQELIGTYWAYDGTPSLCAPPRLYNQIAVQIATERGLDVVELARLMALVNVALADAGVAVWDSKYYYNYWRPVTAIREADVGTGPTGLGDGNPATVGDPTWTPIGAPASNLGGNNFTPPFPAYPSGHACFGGALFQTLRNYFGTDDIEFTFVSDELNGETVDNVGTIRPLVPRTFKTLSQAEEENGQSRIYLGIHWSFDKTEGIVQGRKVADFVFQQAFQPAR
jgi:hypothetical protein